MKTYKTEEEYRKAHDQDTKNKILNRISSIHFKIDKTDAKKNNFDRGVAVMRQFCLELIEKEL